VRKAKEEPGKRLPTLVCLIGPPAVGKMTVGEALCRRTGYRLFSGHHLAGILTPYFPFGTPAYRRLLQSWRRSLLTEALQARLDLVLTTAWRFDVPDDGEVPAERAVEASDEDGAEHSDTCGEGKRQPPVRG
jgi:hypothetical protein